MKTWMILQVSVLVLVSILNFGVYAASDCPADGTDLLPHEDCTKYIECNRGVSLVRPCGPGTHFNANIKVCDWPSAAKCTGGAQPVDKPKDEPREESKQEIKEEPKEEHREELKEEIKEVPKEELKEEIKEETKEELREEPKEESEDELPASFNDS